MATIDQIEALSDEIWEGHHAAMRTGQAGSWVDFRRLYDEYCFKENGIAVVKDERLEYDVAGVKL
jgi:hypothetical protein